MNRDKDIKISKKIYRDNMTNQQKQKQREANRRYQKKYRNNMTDKKKNE